MNSRYKKYLKIYLVPIVFIAVSFIFTTFAWFAYSGLRNVSTEIDVKAWYIELSKSGEVVSNNIVINVNDVYPGMSTVDELISIENKGDSDAKLSYKILSSRILDTETDGEALQDNNELTDSLSHSYPFHVNMDLSKRYVNGGGDTATFEVSVSWPLDSGNDNLDSVWGTNSYNFQKSEQERLEEDADYVPRPAIQIVISVMAEQTVDSQTNTDKRFNMGDVVLYDVLLNRKCEAVSATCLSTTVLDYDNKINDSTVTLLPNLYGTYDSSTYTNYNTTLASYTSNWTVPTRALTVNDLLKVVSHDVINTLLKGDNISPQILGTLDYNNRATTEINRAISFNGYYTFLNNRFSYLSHNNCYWTSSNYNTTNAFAFEKMNETLTKIYPKDKETECRVIPVIVAPKANMQ